MDRPKEMEFTFESDAAASFLVFKCDAKVLEYQTLMLERNHINHVIPVNVVRKESITCLYYNITSKISLSFFLNRRKFSREEFLRFLLQVTAAVNDSAGYLLTDSSFIFDPEYIYISPETLEPTLIYVPALIEESSSSSLQSFISDLVLQHINADGFGGENLVQRILAKVRGETFHIQGLITLLNDLLYGQQPDESDTRAADCGTGGRQGDETPAKIRKVEKRNRMIKGVREGKMNNRIEESENESPEDKRVISGISDDNMAACGKRLWALVLAILVQIVMGGAIYLCRDLLNNASDNLTATYAAVLMIVLAVEVLVFKKLTAARLINVQAVQESSMMDGQTEINGQKETERQNCILAGESVPGRKGDNRQNAATDSSNTIERIYTDAACVVADAASGPAAASVNPVNRAACKTELLGSCKKAARLLISTGKRNSDEDILIDKDDFIIGRLSGHVDHVLKNNAVGKLHAQLICKDGTCYIKDLNSMNGTFINNNRIESNKEFELKENDRLQLANSEFIFTAG